MAAAKAIAGCVPDDKLNAEFILPNSFDRSVPVAVAEAVAKAARRNRRSKNLGGFSNGNDKLHSKGSMFKKIDIEVEDGIVKKVHFTGGCNGNTQGVSKLVEGMKVQDVIDRLEGIDCNGRGTSCPAQLAEALKSAL